MPILGEIHRGKEVVNQVAILVVDIGQNHLGDMDLAKELIELAKFGGADLVKFQLYDHKVLYKDHPEVPQVDLTFNQAQLLFDYGKEVGIEVFFSVFDVERVEWCEKMGVKRYKVAFSQRYNMDIIQAIVATEKPYMISSQYWGDSSQIASPDRLYCVPKYPTLLSDLKFGMEHFVMFDGFSDHTIGIDAAKIALARGAQIIEKHFAIDHKTGIDAEWSMNLDELKELRKWAEVCKEAL